MSKVNEDSGRLDADRLLQRLIDRHRVVYRANGAGRLELYHRASVVLRVTRRGFDDPGQVRLGSEDGIAARVESTRDGQVRFAASAGRDQATVADCVARAAQGSPITIDPSRAFPPAGSTGFDRDPVEALPSPAQLRGWLDSALEALRSRVEPEGKLEDLECWVEAAVTVESLVGPGGVAASRGRTRAWTMLKLRTDDDPTRAAKPVFTAARRWSRLDALGWVERIEERRPARGPAAGSASVSGAVVVQPDAASKLVSGLVRTVHVSPDSVGAEVGPGWRLADEPHSPDALFGGSFDDAGFPTRSVALSDGKRVTGWIGGPGSWRRASFRDPPLPAPAEVVLDAGEDGVVPDALVVSDLQIHPLPGGCWVLEVDGALRRGGEPGPAVRGGFISTRPAKLLQSCSGRIGAARASHRRVRTPALLFTGLVARF